MTLFRYFGISEVQLRFPDILGPHPFIAGYGQMNVVFEATHLGYTTDYAFFMLQ